MKKILIIMMVCVAMVNGVAFAEAPVLDINNGYACFLQVKIPHFCKYFSSPSGGEFHFYNCRSPKFILFNKMFLR